MTIKLIFLDVWSLTMYCTSKLFIRGRKKFYSRNFAFCLECYRACMHFFGDGADRESSRKTKRTMACKSQLASA
jgi:hypothetical protein